MRLEYTDTKEDNNIVILKRISYKYCNNKEGIIYTKSLNDTNDIITKLIKNIRFCVLNKKNTIILNLLVNPYFDELIDYIKCGKLKSKRKLKFINKYIFKYLSNRYVNALNDSELFECSKIYKDKNMYLKSLEMTNLI
jgi:hypothetical protein